MGRATPSFVAVSIFPNERFISRHVHHRGHHESSPLVRLSMLQEAGGMMAATVQTAPVANTYEPIMPDTLSLLGMGSIVVLCVVAAVVWNQSVVPVSRANLAISKSRGQVKEYLEDLKESSDDERPVEKWVFTDWLRDNKSAKASAIPFLKDAKWNSGDNPVVVTAAIMLIGILVASVTERVIPH